VTIYRKKMGADQEKACHEAPCPMDSWRSKLYPERFPKQWPGALYKEPPSEIILALLNYMNYMFHVR
jgi:hypothetical protein